MKALIQKEIRLLAPSWAVAILLAIAPFLAFHDVPAKELGLVPVFPMALGLIILALSSFGREFSLQTFSVTLAQPIQRERIWKTKSQVLMLGAAVALGIWIGLLWLIAPSALTPKLILAAVLALAVAISSGLWSSLLVRQMVGSFWIALFLPLAIILAASLCQPSDLILYPALLVYSAAGYFWAWHLFMGAQETGWASGFVTAPDWLSSRTAVNDGTRAYRPVIALMAKELRLQQPTLLAMAGLFLLHLLALWVRYLTRNWNSYSELRNTLEMAHGTWVMVPLLAGAVSISEERKLGTLSGQLSLPVSSRIQYLLKLAVTLFIGGTLSTLFRWFTECLAPGENFVFKPDEFRDLWLVFTGVAFVSFYASSLAKNIVQGMAGALAIIPSTIVYFVSVSSTGTWQGQDLWRPRFFLTAGVPLVILVALWLGNSNFRSAENSRLWKRNLGIWLAVMLAIPALSFLVYQRTWELVLKLEPAPGKPVLSFQPGEVGVKSDYSGLAVLLPDGRLWVGELYVRQEPALLKPKLNRRCAGAFAPGSNWVDVATLGGNHVAALAKDGSLWLGAQETPVEGGPALWEQFRQYGTETDWTQLAGTSASIALLKKDGTLWFWGTNNVYLRIDEFKPHQIGVSNRWMRLENSRWSVIAFDSEGKGWRPSINTKRTETPAAFADLDPYPLSYPANSKQMVEFNYRFASRYGDRLTYIVNLDQSGCLYGSSSAPLILDQMGSETNWAAINADENSLRALKKDGTLWKLRTEGSARLSAQEPKDLPWDKISKRHDWLALSAPSDVITLAADGTLWWWESEGYPFGPDRYRVLRPSRKPVYLGSIFDQNQAAK